MIHAETNVTLSIRRAVNREEGVVGQITVDGQTVGDELAIGLSRLGEVHFIVDLFRRHFKEKGKPALAHHAATSAGTELFALWLARDWPEIQRRHQSSRPLLLTIASNIPDILNQPWELMLPPAGIFLGLDPNCHLRRMPLILKELPCCCPPTLRPSPLRLLFLSCSPLNLEPLDYPEEESSLLLTLGEGDHPPILFDRVELGSFAAAQKHIRHFQPHLVHLIGRSLVRNGQGYFAFEDEAGLHDIRSTEEMARELFVDSGVHCVVVSGYEKGTLTLAAPVAATGAVCQGLVAHGVPLAVSWPERLAHARSFMREFYFSLAAGLPIDRAIFQGRAAQQEKNQQVGYPGWTLPVLYARTNQSLLFNGSSAALVDQGPPPIFPLLPLPGLEEVAAPSFIGRRREIQTFLPDLREGNIHTLLLLGAMGVGKSALATHLTHELAGAGFTPIVVDVPADHESFFNRLFVAAIRALTAAGWSDEAHALTDLGLSTEVRLQQLTAILQKHPFVLLLDGLDRLLDNKAGFFKDTSAEESYLFLLNQLATGASRGLITSRYAPFVITQTPPKLSVERLSPLARNAFLALLMTDPVVVKRLQRRDVTIAQLVHLYILSGGFPRFIPELCHILHNEAASSMAEELERLARFAATELEKLRIDKIIPLSSVADSAEEELS